MHAKPPISGKKKSTSPETCLFTVSEHVRHQNPKSYTYTITKNVLSSVFFTCYVRKRLLSCKTHLMEKLNNITKNVYFNALLTLLSSKTPKRMQITLYEVRKRDFQKSCLLNVFERVRYQNAKKYGKNPPYMGRQNNITKNVTFQC